MQERDFCIRQLRYTYALKNKNKNTYKKNLYENMTGQMIRESKRIEQKMKEVTYIIIVLIFLKYIILFISI